jgi:hypothetical protein
MLFIECTFGARQMSEEWGELIYKMTFGAFYTRIFGLPIIYIYFHLLLRLNFKTDYHILNINSMRYTKSGHEFNSIYIWIKWARKGVEHTIQRKKVVNTSEHTFQQKSAISEIRTASSPGALICCAVSRHEPARLSWSLGTRLRLGCSQLARNNWTL